MHTHLRLWWIENTLYFTCSFKDFFVQDIDYQVHRCHFLYYGLHYFDEESTVFLILVSLWYAAFWSDCCIFGFSIFLGMSSWVFVFVLVYFSWFYWFVGWYFPSNVGNFQLLFLQVFFFFFPAPLSSLSSWHLNYLYIGLLDIVPWVTGGLCCVGFFFQQTNEKTYSFYLEIVSTYTKIQEYYGKNPTLTLLRFTYCYCFTPALFFASFLSVPLSIHPSCVYTYICMDMCVCIYIYIYIYIYI